MSDTDTRTFEDMLADSFAVDREQATAMLPRIVELEALMKPMEQELGELKAKVKEVLEDDPMPLVDGERGIVATLHEKKKPASIDLATLSTQPHGEQYLGEAARALVLSVVLTPLRALKGKGAWADALLRCEMPGGVTSELKIEVVP